MIGKQAYHIDAIGSMLGVSSEGGGGQQGCSLYYIPVFLALIAF